MKDGDVVADKTLSTADKAIRYLLDRIQHDANLRHYMLGTQAFHLLCEAEAERLGLGMERVKRGRTAFLGERGKPDVVRYRELLDEAGIEY